MSELICPFLPRESWYDEFEGPCVVMKGDYCKVYQQLVERDNRIAELEAERDHFREVAEKLVWLYSDEHQERLDNGLRIDGFYSHEWLGMILDMARDVMKGAEK